MKNMFQKFFLVVSLAVLFTACSKKDDRAKMIPGNALVAAVINTQSLGKKLSWEEVKKSAWFQKIYSDSATKDWMKKVLDDPAASGIDFEDGIVFFVSKGSGKDYNIVFEGKIKNEKDFEAFNKNLDPSSSTQQSGDIKTFVIHEQSVAGWNSSKFAFVTNNSAVASNLPPALDSLSEEYGGKAESVDPSAMTNTCAALFKLKPDSSLYNNKHFTNLLAEKGDALGWVNTEELINSSGALGMLGMFKLDMFIKGNVSTYALNFEDGKIDVKQRGYAGKEFTDFLKKYKGKNINADMLAAIPSKNIVGLGIINYPPEGLKELIKLTGLDGMINSFITEMGFTLDDFVAAQNGDLMLAVTDLAINKEPGVNTEDSSVSAKSTTGANFMFAVGLNNKASFQKLLNAGKQLSGNIPASSKIAFNMSDKYFVMGNDQTTVNGFLSAKSNNNVLFDKIKGHPMAGFVDIQQLIGAVNEQEVKDTNGLKILETSKNFWKNAVYTGGDWEDDALTGHYEINLKDDKTNSLKQLSNYFDVIATHIPKHVAIETGIPADSNMMVPDSVGN